MWPIELHHRQCPWMTLRITFAVWNLSNSHTLWNELTKMTVARSLCGSWASWFFYFHYATETSCVHGTAHVYRLQRKVCCVTYDWNQCSVPRSAAASSRKNLFAAVYCWRDWRTLSPSEVLDNRVTTTPHSAEIASLWAFVVNPS